MQFMGNRKLAARIGILTTVITLVGMTLLAGRIHQRRFRGQKRHHQPND